jgi:signal peptide peptidase SppA
MTAKRSKTPRGQSLQLGDIWYGDDDSMLSARNALTQLAALDPKLYAGDDDGEDEAFDGFPEYSYMLARHGDIAVLSISGSMVSKETYYNRYVGLCSYQEVRNAAIVAAESGCRGLLLDIDTSGGSAEGIGELSDFLTEFDKNVIPVYTYTGTKMLSAGYWIGCIGRKVFSSAMAMDGSIGVVSAHFSYARMLKEQGIDVTMLRQGEFKALGSPYEKLDDKARADIEARMGKFYDLFLSHVSTHRGIAVPALIETAAEGRVFMGDDAVAVGLVDQITTFDKAVSAVMKAVGDRQPQVSVLTPSTYLGVDHMKRKLTDAGQAAVASGMAEKLALADPKLSEEIKEPTKEEREAAEAAALAAAADPVVTDPKVEPEAAPAPAPAAKAEQMSDQTLDKIISLSSDLADARGEVKRLQASESERSASMATLMKICGDAINRMELPLSRSPTSFTGMSAETLIGTYHRTLSDFNSRMKIGAQAEVPGDSDLGEKKTQAYVPNADCVKL